MDAAEQWIAQMTVLNKQLTERVQDIIQTPRDPSPVLAPAYEDLEPVYREVMDSLVAEMESIVGVISENAQQEVERMKELVQVEVWKQMLPAISISDSVWRLLPPGEAPVAN